MLPACVLNSVVTPTANAQFKNTSMRSVSAPWPCFFPRDHLARYSNHLLNNKRNKSTCSRRVNTSEQCNARAARIPVTLIRACNFAYFVRTIHRHSYSDRITCSIEFAWVCFCFYSDSRRIKTNMASAPANWAAEINVYFRVRGACGLQRMTLFVSRVTHIVCVHRFPLPITQTLV